MRGSWFLMFFKRLILRDAYQPLLVLTAPFEGCIPYSLLRAPFEGFLFFASRPLLRDPILVFKLLLKDPWVIIFFRILVKDPSLSTF